MKRRWRELTDSQKKVLSQQAKGKSKSFEHRRHISQGMKKYWEKIPHMPGANEDEGNEEKSNDHNGYWK